MASRYEREEYLEKLWYMKEEEKDSLSVLEEFMGKDFSPDVVAELSAEALVDFNEREKRITLNKKGVEYARQLIRAHRLAERMLHDVKGGDFETGACEFEHTVTPELVDSICILLGHPRECPHGMPIPEGQCCKSAVRTVQSSVVPLTELKVGESVRVAYVKCRDDQQLHRMDALQIRPGAIVKVHQVYPTFVIETDGSNIALDEEVASNICVWKEPDHTQFI